MIMTSDHWIHLSSFYNDNVDRIPKELETALFNDDIDCIVTNLADVPAFFSHGDCIIASVLNRLLPYECLVISKEVVKNQYLYLENEIKFKNLDEFLEIFPPDMKIKIATTTSSARSQLLNRYREKYGTNLNISELPCGKEATLEVKLRKLDDFMNNGYHAMILRSSDMEILKQQDRIAISLKPSDNFFFPPGSGCQSIITKMGRVETAFSEVADSITSLRTIAERGLLRQLDANSNFALGVETSLEPIFGHRLLMASQGLLEEDMTEVLHGDDSSNTTNTKSTVDEKKDSDAEIPKDHLSTTMLVLQAKILKPDGSQEMFAEDYTELLTFNENIRDINSGFVASTFSLDIENGKRADNLGKKVGQKLITMGCCEMIGKVLVLGKRDKGC